MPTSPLLENLVSHLSRATGGLVLGILTLLFGQGLGIVFGLNEDLIKDRLKAGALAVRSTTYHDDDAAIRAVVDKSWTYMQRAHLHAGSLGTTALVLIILMSFLGGARRWTPSLGLALGGGGLGYSLFWMWAGFRAPGLGGTAAAKESLKWLAMPTSGAFVLATAAVLVLVVVNVLPSRRENVIAIPPAA
jgi:hypothetical protein